MGCKAKNDALSSSADKKRTGRAVEVKTLSDSSSSDSSSSDASNSSSSEEEEIQVIYDKIKRKSHRVYYDKPTSSSYGSGKLEAISMIFKSSRNRGVNGTLIRKEKLTLDGARDRDDLGGLHICNTGQLHRKYRRIQGIGHVPVGALGNMDTLK